ncbi:Nephrocystin-3 [Stylophora pistillata]|uniref:Nephrocystin-3 n=1 Tax=Stylophora pistillata TaxID=50429 RepID=A0A2B4RSC1_STYPI|nr:Nephrocystin-3 [Stylophora pistillata]
MALQPFTNEQLNCFKFALIAFNEIPKALRQTFKQMWDTKFASLPNFQAWDDSNKVRTLFLRTEGGATKVPTNRSFDEWDCTALFQATIHARSFALPGSKGHHRTLYDLYVKPCKLPHGTFHSSVVSSTGDNAETFALAIDQIRLLRNSFCHAFKSELDKTTFDRYVKLAKDAIKALGVNTGPIDAVGSLTESDFPTQEVQKIRDDIRKEVQKENEFLREEVKDDLQLLKKSQRKDTEELKKTLKRTKTESQDITNAKIAKLQTEVTSSTKDVKDDLKLLRKSQVEGTVHLKKAIETENAASREMMTEKFAEFQNKGIALREGVKDELKLLQESQREGIEELKKAIETVDAGSQEMVNRKFADFDKERIALVKNVEDELKLLQESYLESTSDLKKTFGMANAAGQEMINAKFSEIQTESSALRKAFKREIKLLQESRGDDTLDLKTIASSQTLVTQIISELNQTIKDLLKEESSGSKLSLPRSNLPPMVPHFTGREEECDQIIGHMTSDSTRIVSVWGSPGFGKTSTAIAVGHRLRERGLPVYFISLRGLKSKGDLMSKLLSFFRTDKSANQGLTVEDEIGFIFERLSDHCVLILDNADDLFECGAPTVKEETVNLLKEILNRSERVDFLLTTRESMAFMNVSLQGHQSVRIRELETSSSKTLVRELLPEVNTTNVMKIVQICGQVPLAIKLLCSSLSEDFAHCSSDLDELLQSKRSLIELLDNPDYTSDLRLKTLFESSFQRLSSQNQEALISLCILPENFDLTIAKAVLGLSSSSEAKKVLRELQRRSLIDSCPNLDEFSIHKLLQSYAKHKGELDMKETILLAKTRFLSFFISLFDKLNEMFLTGKSMTAFIEFFENEKSIFQSLINGCSDCKTAEKVFNILLKSEMFLDTVYWDEEAKFEEIYLSAITAANKVERRDLHGKLLQSKAFGKIMRGDERRAIQLLAEAKRIQCSTSTGFDGDKGKYFCYFGIHKLVTGKTQDGVQSLQEAIDFMNNTPEHKVLKLIAFQILAVFYQSQSDHQTSSMFYGIALQEVKEVGDTDLLMIPDVNEKRLYAHEQRKSPLKEKANHPIKIEVMTLVELVIGDISTRDINEFFSTLMLKVLEDTKSATGMTKLGWFKFHEYSLGMLVFLNKNEEGVSVAKERITYHQESLQKIRESNNPILKLHKDALAKCYSQLAHHQECLNNSAEAVNSAQHALTIMLQLFGEGHAKTANSHHQLGFKQYKLGDYSSAAESHKRALGIRIRLLGEEHKDTADSYSRLGFTQHNLGDYSPAAESHKRALSIRIKILGEEHVDTADSYCGLGVTQNALEDYSSAAESHKRALSIRMKLFGEEHADTADSYYGLGVAQHNLGDYSSAAESHKPAESHKRALSIRIKLLGEEHADTADSYYGLGVAQYNLGDYSSAAESHKRALNIRTKRLGKEQKHTVDGYCLLGVTQNALEDSSSAAESHKRALGIRIKLLEEEHVDTADSYSWLGFTQHGLGDYSSAAESRKRALGMRIKLLGEKHADTIDGYRLLGVTQNALEDSSSAAESHKRALGMRIKLLGEKHADTTDGYRLLGVTQNALEDSSSAAESHKRALGIRIKLLEEEYVYTADSYSRLGFTQHWLGDYSSAAESHKRAHSIRIKLLGEKHADTADSYRLLGVTQNALEDYSSAAESHKRALSIRIKLPGEEHKHTADSYRLLGVTQNAVEDYSSAAESHKRALSIRINLLGVEHADTADSYRGPGVAQHNLGDYSSAAKSHKRACGIRIKLLGEEHVVTADSYSWLGFTQHELGDYSSAGESHKRDLASE